MTKSSVWKHVWPFRKEFSDHSTQVGRAKKHRGGILCPFPMTAWTLPPLTSYSVLKKQVSWLVTAWEFTRPGIISRPCSLAREVGTMLPHCFLCSQSASFPSTEGALSVQPQVTHLIKEYQLEIQTCRACFSSNCQLCSVDCSFPLQVSSDDHAEQDIPAHEFHDGGTLFYLVPLSPGT